MCYYDTITYACSDWKWGNCRQQCDREYRMGETCGMKLVYENTSEKKLCKICLKLETKRKRIEREYKRYKLEMARKRDEKECILYQTLTKSSYPTTCRSEVGTSLEDIRGLDSGITAVEKERIDGYIDNLRCRKFEASRTMVSS
jgi:hypothetical protein